MSDYRLIARPYARAIYEIAVTDGNAAQWEADLAQLSDWALHPEVNTLFFHPKVPASVLAETLLEAMGNQLSLKVRNFIKVLGDNKRLYILPDVLQLFREYQASDNAKVNAVLTTSVQATSKIMKAFEGALAQKLACSVEITNEIDPLILGGAVIRIGDWVIDGSIRGKLARLSKALVS